MHARRRHGGLDGKPFETSCYRRRVSIGRPIAHVEWLSKPVLEQPDVNHLDHLNLDTVSKQLGSEEPDVRATGVHKRQCLVEGRDPRQHEPNCHDRCSGKTKVN